MLILATKFSNINSVCFASLYRIITITRLVHTTDISWAKSDVFIWSSVEPSIGIISGCLPTLRPLMVQVMNALSSRIPSSRKSSRYTESPANSLNPLETISKKRTRKININDTLEGTINNEENRGERKSWIRSKTEHEHWGRSRLDEDEMCLTTTTVHGSDKEESDVHVSDLSQNGREERGITMTRKFEWDEGTPNRDLDK
jgi:post-segregation antitoxin (ccd killing protein)